MSSSCNGQCGSCHSASACSSDVKKETEKQNNNNIKHVIGVISGKGGVGKSFVTSMLAVNMRSRGYSTAILDADIVGPSIPMSFGIENGIAMTSDKLLVPALTQTGIQIMSSNLLLNKPTDPVIWRGPVIAQTVKQFWSDCFWGDVDYMFVDMPPGTGDVALTVFQTLPIEGIIIVTSPQDLVSMIVAKAVNMAKKMNIPILGLVENMSYFKCEDCGSVHNIFGESHIDEAAKEHELEVLAKLPIDPKMTKMIDEGRAEFIETGEFDKAIEKIIK